MFRKIKDIIAAPKRLQRLIDSLEFDLDTLKSKLDLEESFLDTFHATQQSPEYLEVYSKPEPLVSVCIATYNRAQLLVERSLASVLSQTYRNLEVIVIGDGCTDDTAERIGRIEDSRLRFENLPERGGYPDDPHLRWMVAGTTPVLRALEIARGDFITHLDDDDRFPEERLEKLVKFIQQTKADLVWHPFFGENAHGRWDLKPCPEFKKGQVTTSSIFYHNWFKCIPWELDAYRYREPGDWNRFRKLRYLGARLERYPEPLLWHYMERAQNKVSIS